MGQFWRTSRTGLHHGPIHDTGTQHMPRTRVLFLCTGNSCRSHMAEGFLRALGGDAFDVASAGARPTGQVHPLAVQVMREAGVDISTHTSKHLDQFIGQPFDFVITVCDQAREACPVFPGAQEQRHWSFADPAAATGTDEQKLRFFRQIRDEIRHDVRCFLRAGRANDR